MSLIHKHVLIEQLVPERVSANAFQAADDGLAVGFDAFLRADAIGLDFTQDAAPNFAIVCAVDTGDVANAHASTIGACQNSSIAQQHRRKQRMTKLGIFFIADSWEFRPEVS